MPPGAYAIEFAGPYGSRSGTPPGATRCSHLRPSKGWPWSLAYRMRPSRSQPVTVQRAPWKVTLRAAPPPAGITYTSSGPSSRPTNASWSPRGEMRG
ncbi:hypothetical protein ACFQES_01855 [Nonomuraea salmonea]|uniref:hypothetical protein n=1 Tax=Nonomuraea salmonea TaxID=46181 RepID=UPI002FE8BE1B